MHDIHIDRKTADKWQKIATLFRTASDAMGQAELILKLELNITEGRAVQEVERAIEALGGNAYMFTPQSEWTDGENFKTRPPHIVNSPALPS